MKSTDPYEQSEEYRYRYEERLGILCGSEEPTEAQIKMARDEADQWVKEQSE